MSDAFKIKRGDTSPSIRYKLRGVDLTGSTARFLMRVADQPESVAVVNEVCDLSQVGADAIFQYDWAPSDTAEAGNFDAEFEVTYPGGAIETFPNKGYVRILVTADIRTA